MSLIGVYNISDALSRVISDKNDLITAANNLTTALNNLAADINNTKTTCSSSSLACQTACDTLDVSQLSSASTDFSSVSYSVQHVNFLMRKGLVIEVYTPTIPTKVLLNVTNGSFWEHISFFEKIKVLGINYCLQMLSD